MFILLRRLEKRVSNQPCFFTNRSYIIDTNVAHKARLGLASENKRIGAYPVMKQDNVALTSAEIVATTLRQSIERGVLKPGEKLHTLKEMESMYCVSRVAVRDAIKILEGEGLLLSRQGSGIYVTNQPRALMDDRGRKTQYPLTEIFSLFEFLCNYACFALKERKDLSEIKELKQTNTDMRKNYASLTMNQKFIYESSFSLRFVRLAGNSLAADLCTMLVEPLTYIDYFLIQETELYQEILQLDALLLDALLERDPYSAMSLGRSRCQKTLAVIPPDDEFWVKKSQVF